jgi:hypothetical protein
VLSATNQVFAAELCISQQIRCSLPNYVVRNESDVRCRIMFSVANQVFAAEFVLSAANQLFAIELCCPQGTWFSLPNYVDGSESGFTVEVVLFVANLRLLSKLCFLQRKCDSLPKSSCLHRISICCSEVAFAAKIMVPAAKHFSLSNYAAGSEPIFSAEVCDL